MQLTVVGCGDAFGSGGRFNTCFWLEIGSTTICLDFGASSPVALKKLGLDPRRIDTIILSHLHGDHFGGLPFLLLDFQFALRRDRPLTIVGPPGLSERIEAATKVFFPGAWERGWRYELNLVELPCNRMQHLGELALSTYVVDHPSGATSTALRIETAGRVLTYSGDTAWTDTLVEAAAGADLFILECYRPRDPVPGHLDLETIEANRSRLPDRILLTHMGPAMLDHMAAAEARGYLGAHDGLVLTV